MNAYARTSTRDPARDRRIAEHLDMARRIALRLGRRLPPWLQEDDLVAAATVGLAEAAERYDDTRGEPFVAFAEKRIRGAVLDELRRGDLLPRRLRTEARRVGQTISQLEQQLGRAPEDEEIATALGVTLDAYRAELEGLTQVSFVELDGQEDSGSRHFAAPGSPHAHAERAEMVSRLKEALVTLQPRDAQILSLYYVEDFGYAEIGEVLGVSESRVCQLHGRAIARLRVALAPAGMTTLSDAVGF